MLSVCNADIFGRSPSYEDIDIFPGRWEKNGTAVIDKYLYKMLTVVAKSVDEKIGYPNFFFYKTFNKNPVFQKFRFGLRLVFDGRTDWIHCILF